MNAEQRLSIPGDFGEWIEVGEAELPVGGHGVVWTVTRIHFNRSRSSRLRARGVTSAGKTWLPLENPPFWLEALIREAEGLTSLDNEANLLAYYGLPPDGDLSEVMG